MDVSHINHRIHSNSEYAIEIKEGNFSWTVENSNEPPNVEDIHLKNIDLKIKKGEFVTLIGAYGSGKSSLTKCLLGEMNKTGNPSININGSIAYVNQVPWIMNDTIRNNILFGKEYNIKKYAEVIKFSSLETDLLLFSNGDL